MIKMLIQETEEEGGTQDSTGRKEKTEPFVHGLQDQRGL